MKRISGYFEQATAYAIAWQERTGIPIRTAILVSTEEGITQVFEGNPIARSFIGDLKLPPTLIGRESVEFTEGSKLSFSYC